jgi:hypothetical protein
LDFDSILKDSKISSFANDSEKIRTIGFESVSNQIGRNIFPSSIGLDNNLSLAEMNLKIQALHSNPSLNIDPSQMEMFEDILEVEFNFAKRICINFSKNSEIISIDSETLFPSFVNSDLEKLVQTIIVIQKSFNTYTSDFSPSMTKLMLNNMMCEVGDIDPQALDEDSRWYQIIQAATLDIEYEYE